MAEAVLSYPRYSGKEYGTPVVYDFLLFSIMIGKTCVVYIYDFQSLQLMTVKHE